MFKTAHCRLPNLSFQPSPAQPAALRLNYKRWQAIVPARRASKTYPGGMFMTGKNTAAFGIYHLRKDAEFAVDTLRAEGFRNTDISVLFAEKEGGILLSVHCDNSKWTKKAKDTLERTGAVDTASTGEAHADWHRTDKPLPRAS